MERIVPGRWLKTITRSPMEIASDKSWVTRMAGFMSLPQNGTDVIADIKAGLII